MHPILVRGGRLALYLALWILVGAVLALVLVAQLGTAWNGAALIAIPLAALYAFVCLSAWYVARGMPLAATGAPRVVATALTASTIASAAWLAAARGWIVWVSARGWVPPFPRGTAGLYPLLSAFGVLLYLLSLAVSYLLVVFEHTREAERRALEVQVLGREAQLRMLRAQIDPHFLFNSLHSISALTVADAPAARRMCVLLAEFLRESLALGGRDRITLGREVGLVERFLAVERIRFGDRLQTAIVVEPEAGDILVPPLLLQPLVENAVTHGVAHVVEGGTVHVRAHAADGRLRIAVENPCDPDRPRRTGAGVGIANVRARLAALHGEDAHVTVRETAGRWHVELSLPAAMEAPPAGARSS